MTEFNKFIRGPARTVTITGEFGSGKIQIAAGSLPDYPGFFTIDFVQKQSDGRPGVVVISICTSRKMIDLALDAIMKENHT